MNFDTLQAISPLDGRYHQQVENLSLYFSEYALIRYRLVVEIEYLIALEEKKFFKLSAKTKMKLKQLLSDFSISDAEQVKSIEKVTNHDVKAIEYFLKEKLKEWGEDEHIEWVHFGLTSQDINNTAFPLLWKEAMEFEYLPAILNIQTQLKKMADGWMDIPMLSHTHGQPASPTRLGKELMVFIERIEEQIQLFSYIPFTAKFGGATGNFNAHVAAFPSFNWVKFSNSFLENKLGLQRQQITTQIEHYDILGAHFDAIKRINTILIDLSRDMWMYIGMEYFKQKLKKGEIGSSTMPHKVNPIDFENAEGNLGIGNAIFEHLSAKLPISRLQRDLTDSTVLRNAGVPLGHTLLAIKSLSKGLDKLVLNEKKIRLDLNQNWAVIAEAIQTILRREHYPEPYEALKELTRGNDAINKEKIHNFIDGLKLSAKVKKELKSLRPDNYLGI